MTIDQTQSDSLSISRGQFLRPSHRTLAEQIVGLSIYLLICIGLEALLNFKDQLWGTLYYLALALSMWTLWRRYSLRVLKLELSTFVAQLILQIAWSLSYQEKLLSLVALLLLWCSTLLAALLFWKKGRLSGGILLFPLVWIFYHAGLNMITCISNP